MSNTEENFVAYFKIKWSKKSTWTLEQAAYLSCGKDPDAKECEISPIATNPVSRRYYWLLNKRMSKENYLCVMDLVDGIEHFNTGSLFRKLGEKFKIEKDMQKAFDHMYKAPFGVDHTKFVTRAAYREAGRIVFPQYPGARRQDIAKAIKDLPQYFNNDEHGHIETLEWHQIEPYLKGLSGLDQKPAKDDIPEIKIDLKQLVELM